MEGDYNQMNLLIKIMNAFEIIVVVFNQISIFKNDEIVVRLMA